MVKRIITALLLLGFALPCMIFQGMPFLILVLFFVALALYETLNIYANKWHKVSTYIIAIAMMLSVLFLPMEVGIPLVIVACGYVLYSDEMSSIDEVSIVFMNAMIFILSVHNVKTYGSSTYGAVYFLIFGCSLICDTGAYFIGSKFGKHKLCPRLSPKKSVEGAIGGWVIGIIYGLICGYVFINVIPSELTWPFVIVSALIVPLFSELGDLYFSSIKRHVGIKDFGNIFPGHGGGLDRIDGLLFGLMSVNGLLMLSEWLTRLVI